MGLLAKRNTNGNATLTRGLAQALPFAGASFDTILATFPADYINDPQTLREVKRCLSDGGRFIVLLAALQMGHKPLERMMSLLFRITHQSPGDPLEDVKEKLRTPFAEAGFEVEVQELQVKSSLLLAIIASR
jgi:ubiquinone/menaquinone biosynthesis C-methylase UbiE